MEVLYKRGIELTSAQQRQVLAAYVHRFTGDHRPRWAEQRMPNGKAYPLQFANDHEWLANTEFPVTEKGELHKVETDCRSTPTWPHNPELRRGRA